MDRTVVSAVSSVITAAVILAVGGWSFRFISEMAAAADSGVQLVFRIMYFWMLVLTVLVVICTGLLSALLSYYNDMKA